MIVGETLSGKTSCIRVLVHALNSLANSGNSQYTGISLHTINPKAITIGQLYGTFDAGEATLAEFNLTQFLMNGRMVCYPVF